MKFVIEIDHPAAWTTIQVLGYALNDPLLNARTIFKPVSAPPYLNGGPGDYLSWVIEGDADANANLIAELLQAEFEWLPSSGILTTER